MTSEEYGKIQATLHHLLQMDEHAKVARLLLNELMAEHDAKDDVADYRRTLFRVIENDVIPFPVPREEKREKPDVGTSGAQKQGFVEFTEKEILQMPQQFRKIFRTNKHTAHVRRKNGYYEIRIQINGHRISATAKCLDTAKERFLKKLKEFNKKGAIPKRRTEILFLPYILRWMETVKKPFIKETTYKMYIQIYNAYLLPSFENRAIKSLTQFELQEFINKFIAAGKNRTAAKISLLLSAVLDYAVDDGIILRSPMKRVIVARYEEEHGQSLNRDEEKLLISAFENNPNEYAQAYVFMLYTGIRRGELESVEVSDGWVSVVTGKQRKGVKAKIRQIPICPMLGIYLSSIDIASIKRISPAMLTKHIKDFLPSHHCHDLRHTFITRAQECGIKRELVSLWVGHAADSSITSTVYTHLGQNKEHQIKEMSLFVYDLE